MSGRNGRSDGAALEAENTRLRQTVMQLEQAVAKAKAEAAAASAAATAAAAAAAAATAKKNKTSEKGENDTSVLKTQLGLLKDRAATLEERSAADQAALKALQKESGAETQRLRAEVAEHQLRLTKANEVINMLKERAETLEARSSADAAALQALQRDNADAARARAEAESQKNAQKPSFLNKILRRGASEK
jgi:chromodomain-helicase-DNA-binding protein 7